MKRPSSIAIHGVDYLDYRNKGVTEFKALTEGARDFVAWIERELGVTVNFVGTGPTNEESIDRREDISLEALDNFSSRNELVLGQA